MSAQKQAQERPQKYVDLEVLAREYEHFETPRWAARAVLLKERLAPFFIDPCCGTGVLHKVAHDMPLRSYGMAMDICDWGYQGQDRTCDFLEFTPSAEELERWKRVGFDVLMNPPFTKACAFVEKAQALGAEKIICFQRLSWLESLKRRDFWENNPPSRIYLCGDRATCWRHDLAQQDRDEDRKAKSNTATAHAWFVWDVNDTSKMTISHIWKDETQKGKR